MRFLIFMDSLRTDLVWIGWALLLALAVYLIRVRMVRGWRKTTVRVVGVTLLAMFIFVSLVLAVGILLGADPPREHIRIASATGRRKALLSHSSLRDSATTQVSVKEGCCRRAIVYEYFGDGDDYMDAISVRWLDDHHLAISYAVDTSQSQVCHTQAEDVQVFCQPHPAPVFETPHN